MISFDRFVNEPRRGLAALILAQCVLWSVAPMVSHSAPPLDVVEMYAWGREGVVATFKHPNLPGLILEAIRRVTGQAGWPAYLVSQACIGVTFWAVFELGRDLLDERRALAGVLMLTGVYFFSWPTPEFNHNVLQMPLWALTALFLWRATKPGGLLNWVLLGVVAGLSIWAKYSSAMLLLPALIWLLWDSKTRRSFLTPGPYLALIVFALVVAPQALFLFETQFAPLNYAETRGGAGGILPTLEFAVLELANNLPLILLLLFAGWFGKPAAQSETPRTAQRTMQFLFLIGLGPLVISMVLGIFGAGLRTSWAVPMFNLIGLIIAGLLTNKINKQRLHYLSYGAAGLLVVVSSLYFIHMRFGASFTNKPLKGNWPQAEITRTLEDKWRMQTNGAPLRIVAGDIWTAGLVGMRDAKPPSVLIDGDITKSTWLTPQDLRSHGAIAVWREKDAPPALFASQARTSTQSLEIPYRDFPKAPPLKLNYLIIPPDAQ